MIFFPLAVRCSWSSGTVGALQGVSKYHLPSEWGLAMPPLPRAVGSGTEETPASPPPTAFARLLLLAHCSLLFCVGLAVLNVAGSCSACVEHSENCT